MPFSEYCRLIFSSTCCLFIFPKAILQSYFPKATLKSCFFEKLTCKSFWFSKQQSVEVCLNGKYCWTWQSGLSVLVSAQCEKSKNNNSCGVKITSHMELFIGWGMVCSLCVFRVWLFCHNHFCGFSSIMYYYVILLNLLVLHVFASSTFFDFIYSLMIDCVLLLGVYLCFVLCMYILYIICWYTYIFIYIYIFVLFVLCVCVSPFLQMH